jgi:hypothetical protein
VQALKLANALSEARGSAQPRPDLLDALFEALLLERELAEIRKADPDAQLRIDSLRLQADGMQLIRPSSDSKH